MAGGSSLEPGILQAMLEHAPDAVVVIEESGAIVFVNRQTELYFGYGREELLGKPIELLVPERFRSIHPEYRRGYFSHPAARPMGAGLEPNGRRKDGSEFPIDASLSPIRTDRGLLVMAIVRDISARRRLLGELSRKTADLEDAVRELREADRYKDEFLSVISHELKTPLNFVLGFASMLDEEVEGSLTPDQHEEVKRILEGGQRLLGIANNLIDMAEIVAGRFELSPSWVDYAALVEQVLAELRPLAEAKGLHLEARVDLAGELHLDGQRIHEVLVNLVDNAIKFTPASGAIRVRAFERRGELVTEVQDTGIGISPGDIRKLFHPFRQLDMSATRRAGGTGLGLSLAKAFVEAHGGRIGVRSLPGQGSTFWFEVPLGKPEE
ncbi:MAG TPA: PAS domain-containing sensor histidine kinase [Pantanalinema sp.]